MLSLLMNIAHVCVEDRPITLVKDRKLHPACYNAPKPGSVDYVNERRRDYISLLKKGMIHKCAEKCRTGGRNARVILGEKANRLSKRQNIQMEAC